MLNGHTARRFYCVAVSRTEQRDSWRWEIRRKRSTMGVKVWEGGFRSFHAAQLAGKQALEDFLNGLSIEANSREFL
jgi:hypothetical protein